MIACKYMSFESKRKLMDALAKGDQKAIEYVIREFDRLENTIRSHETRFDVIQSQIDNISDNTPAAANF